jgi:hypothetical protein
MFALGPRLQLPLRVQRQQQPAAQQQPPPHPHALLFIARVRAMKTRKILALVELLICQLLLIRPIVRILQTLATLQGFITIY